MQRTESTQDERAQEHRPGATGKLRVFLADDHAVLRSGLRLLINSQPDLEVVGEAGDGQEAVERVTALARTGAVDVVACDIDGIVHAGRASLNDSLRWVAENTNAEKLLPLISDR